MKHVWKQKANSKGQRSARNPAICRTVSVLRLANMTLARACEARHNSPLQEQIRSGVGAEWLGVRNRLGS